MLNTLGHKENANHNDTEITPHFSRMTIIKKITINVNEDTGEKELPYTVGQNAN
jgi:hypothetical protein